MVNLVVREIKEQEISAAASFVAEVLAGGDRAQYKRIYDRYAKHLPKRPRQTDRCYYGVVHQNQIIALIHTIDFSLRYGRAVLNVCGVGLVCTHPQYRHRGYASALLKDTLTFAAEQGAHLVVLNSTLPDYFQQFGFSPIWATYTLQAPAAIAANLVQPLNLRVATPSDLGRIEHLYNQVWGTRLTIERSHVLWRWRMELGRGDVLVIVDAQQQIKGYIWHLPEDFSSRNEVVATTPQAIKTALAYSGRRWLAGGHDNLIWSVPPDDMIIPFARQMLPITLSASYHPTGAWMARVIDSSALLHDLLPELLAQAQASHPHLSPRDLQLTMTPDGVDISLHNNPQTHSHLSLRDFMQLVFGAIRPESLAVRQRLPRASIRLLESLFPPRIAALAAWDWF